MATDEIPATEVDKRPFVLSIALWLLGFVAVIALAAWLAYAVWPSMPQRSVTMAIYPEGSLNANLVKRYQDILARDGIELKLDPSAGAVESLADLRNPKSGTSIALVPGGLTSQQQSPDLVSLGTLFYQPLWIFSRRHVSHGRPQLRGLRVSIGPDRSSTHLLALELLGRAGMIDPKSATLLSLEPTESSQKLIDGQIDVAILLDGWESPTVQQLLNAKGVTLESVPRADAFVAIYPYLSKLVLPAGVVNMAEPRPASDVLLIAPKSNLVVRKDLHPAIQYRLLEAALEIHSPPAMFQVAGQFPAAESTDLPLSPYAREFYKTGTPFLLRHLPFWLAIFLAQPVVWLIPLVLLAIPVFRLAPTIYDWAERRRIYKFYSELRRVEDELTHDARGQSQNQLLARLDRLDDRASHLSVPASYKPLVYSLRLHIDMVRRTVHKTAAEEHS
jgi:TRAP-type uncharacterized transport system substrate-binding protein